jgi:imidazoleglycerol phosphate dehydratase HisB
MDVVLTPPEGLRRRLAEVLGVPAARVLPVRGRSHGIELLVRRAALDGFGFVDRMDDPALLRAAAVNRLPLAGYGDPVGFRIVSRRPPEDLPALAMALTPGALVVDDDEPDPARRLYLDQIDGVPGLVVLRTLEGAAALVAAEERLAGYEAVLEADAFPEVLVRETEAALSPERLVLQAVRRDRRRREVWRLTSAVRETGCECREAGSRLALRPAAPAVLEQALARYGVPFESSDDEVFVPMGEPPLNDRILAALGAPVGRAPRRAEVVRETRETRIVCAVDLDDSAAVSVATGIGYYDHMLEQIAFHGGFGLTLACRGDLEIDPHHTVEDCSIVLGQALKSALGDRRGIGRFGFVLPMDEAEAKVSLDLGGRPFSLFEGEFRADRIGEYPTELTSHVFRSLAENLGASIHVAVTGENDHHKTEACFKALGRALRQAVRIEGETLPSTKGVI